MFFKFLIWSSIHLISPILHDISIISLSNLEIVTEEENLKRANENYIIDLSLGETDIPDWKIRISDGVHEYRSIAKACNDLVARTQLNRDEAIKEVYGSLIFGIKKSN